MNSSPFLQTTGNICVALAAMVFLLPLQRLMWDYARRNLSNDQWMTPALFALVPLWLLLMAALLCVTASGGFDWLRLGRPALHTLTVGAALSLAAVSFVLVALFIRPGFTPRMLYLPPLFVLHLATILLVVTSLNPKLAPGLSPQAIRVPWTIFAGICLVVGLGVGGRYLFRAGFNGVTGIAYRLRNPSPSSAETLAKIATLDPQRDFTSLLSLAHPDQGRNVSDAAMARLRSDPKFVETLASELESGHVEPAVAFLHHAALTPAEQSRLAGPARTAMERWVNRIPAPNYTTKAHLKQLRRWGTEMFRGLSTKFGGTGVDFAPTIADFEARF